jgi:hypothetical protein
MTFPYFNLKDDSSSSSPQRSQKLLILCSLMGCYVFAAGQCVKNRLKEGGDALGGDEVVTVSGMR